MTEAQQFWLVFVLLYLSEGVCWASPSAWGMVWRPGGWRVVPPSRAGGKGRVFVGWPVPPRGCHLAGDWPASVTAVGGATWTLTAPNPGAGPRRRLEPWVWGESAMPAIPAAFEAQRRWFVRLAKSLAAAAPEARSGMIDAAVAAFLDTTAAQAAVDRFRRETSGLRWLGLGLLGLWGAAIPMAWMLAGSRWPFFAVLGVSWLGMLVQAVMTWRLWSRLYPDRGEDRFQHTLLTALVPFHAIRAADGPAREWFAAHHPLAIATVLLPESACREFAARLWRDAVHPRPLDGPGLAAAREFHIVHWRPALENALRLAGYDPAALLAPPAGTTIHCPRCHGAFDRADAVCTDCGGLAVVHGQPVPAALE